MLDAMSTVETVSVRYNVGVDGPLATNMIPGTVTDFDMSCLTSGGAIGGSSGFVTCLTVACRAR